MPTYPLAIPVGIALDNVAQFNLLIERAEKVSLSIEAMLAEIEAVTRRIEEEFLKDHVDRLALLRSRVRILTRGAIVLDSHELDTGPEVFRASPAEAQMCVRLWKRLSLRIHPDRGGDPRTFQQASRAYKNRDLHTLQYIWDAVMNFKHPGWKSSNVTYARERLAHLTLRREQLKETKSFAVVRYYRSGRTEQAVNTCRAMLLGAIYEAELQIILLTKKAAGQTNAELLQEAIDAGRIEVPQHL